MERRLTGFVERGDLAMSRAVAPQARDAAAAGPTGAITAAGEASSESDR
jgi:hypothetical protein